jgi:predicted ATP-grasp superfamily ATP-dependent carboligase
MRWPTVLVTGAEEHQGLAVIRGLGRAGIPVVAAGLHRRSLGFYSRYAQQTAVYASPFRDREQFLADILDMVERTRPALIIPTAESTLVVLNAARDLLPAHTALAAPTPETLDYAIDKLRTVTLASALEVPVPRTAWGTNVDQIMARTEAFTFPVAVKPRGNALYSTTANRLGFKVRYLRSRDQLHRALLRYQDDIRAVLVQEYASGTGRCVTAVCRDGTPMVQFAYARVREFPLSGGVSTVRSSIPLDPRVEEWTARLLGAMGWQGVAMVEFKYDAAVDRYVLMEVNGRFQASTALSLDAGVNLPYVVACVFLNRTPELPGSYRIGVRERWLRGDLMALRDGLAFGREASPTRAPSGDVPWRSRILWQFLRDFAPGTHYDELKLDDWRPAVIELGAVSRIAGQWLLDVIKEPARRAARILHPREGVSEVPA